MYVRKTDQWFLFLQYLSYQKKMFPKIQRLHIFVQAVHLKQLHADFNEWRATEMYLWDLNCLSKLRYDEQVKRLQFGQRQYGTTS